MKSSRSANDLEYDAINIALQGRQNSTHARKPRSDQLNNSFNGFNSVRLVTTKNASSSTTSTTVVTAGTSPMIASVIGRQIASDRKSRDSGDASVTKTGGRTDGLIEAADIDRSMNSELFRAIGVNSRSFRGASFDVGVRGGGGGGGGLRKIFMNHNNRGGESAARHQLSPLRSRKQHGAVSWRSAADPPADQDTFLNGVERNANRRREYFSSYTLQDGICEASFATCTEPRNRPAAAGHQRTRLPYERLAALPKIETTTKHIVVNLNFGDGQESLDQASSSPVSPAVSSCLEQSASSLVAQTSFRPLSQSQTNHPSNDSSTDDDEMSDNEEQNGGRADVDISSGQLGETKSEEEISPFVVSTEEYQNSAKLFGRVEIYSDDIHGCGGQIAAEHQDCNDLQNNGVNNNYDRITGDVFHNNDANQAMTNEDAENIAVEMEADYNSVGQSQLTSRSSDCTDCSGNDCDNRTASGSRKVDAATNTDRQKLLLTDYERSEKLRKRLQFDEKTVYDQFARTRPLVQPARDLLGRGSSGPKLPSVTRK